VYTRTSYGLSRMEHIAQIAYFSPLFTGECVEGEFCELRIDGVLGNSRLQAPPFSSIRGVRPRAGLCRISRTK
jgi:hypothetical protein